MQKHVTLKLLIKIKVLVIMNSPSQIILTYLSFIIKKKKISPFLLRLLAKIEYSLKKKKASSPSFIVKFIIA